MGEEAAYFGLDVLLGGSIGRSSLIGDLGLDVLLLLDLDLDLLGTTTTTGLLGRLAEESE